MKLIKSMLSVIVVSTVICGCTDKTISVQSVAERAMIEEKQFPYEQQFINKNFPYSIPDYRAYKLAKQEVANRTRAGVRSEGKWKIEGPGNLGARVNTLAVNPNNGNEIIAGFASGGVFRTADNALSWQPIFDDQPDLNIGDITYDPNNPSIIYIGTGDPNISGFPKIGSGIFKSIDGGDSWVYKGLEEASIISRVHVAPTNSDVIYGDTWTMLDGGLPISDQMGRIGLTISGQNYNNIYASYVNTGGNDSCSNAGSQLLGIWKTTDAGNSWTEINTLPETGLPCNALGGFAWYFGQVRVNPNDDNDIFVLGVDMWRSRDSGESWSRAVPLWSTYDVHADKHDLIWDGNRMLLATDGGIYQSIDDGADWTDIENIAATQFYRIGYNPHKPNWHYGGAQDNGTTGGNAAMINEWPRLYGGDGFTIDFDISDSLIYYASSQNGNLVVTYNGGINFNGARSGFDNSESTNWDTPYFVSKHDPKILYAGRESVYRGYNDGNSVQWSKISQKLIDSTDNENFRTRNISTVHQSPLIEEYLYAGTTDGLVWSSLDGGVTWDNVSEGVPYRYVSDIVASPSIPNTAYVSVTGYKSNDFVAHIHRTDDNGQTWIPISGDLPQISINDIFVHPEYNDNVIFVATDGGIYFTENAGETWTRLGDNMPIIEVYDMVYNPVNNELVAGTFARGIQSFDLQQIGLDAGLSSVSSIPTSAIKVYPSVTDSRLTATWQEYRFDRYTITSMKGRILEKGEINGKMLNLDVSYFTKGSYVLTFENKLGIVSKRFVKM